MKPRMLPCDHPLHLVKLNKAGLALRQLRRARGLTQREVAAACGLHRTTITRLERHGPGRWADSACYDKVVGYLTSLPVQTSPLPDLHQLRRQAQLTQHQLAALSGISQPTISRLERDPHGGEPNRRRLITCLTAHLATQDPTP